MGHKFVDIKFTDPETDVVSFGKVSEDSLPRWLGKGYTLATAEDLAAAKSPQPSDVLEVTDEDLEQGLVLDQPSVEDQDATDVAPAVADEQLDGVTPDVAPQNSDTSEVVGDSTAGDDADSGTTDEQPARGGRRNR